MGLFGPGKSAGQHSIAALRERQNKARMQDANASAHPNRVLLKEIKRGEA